MHFKLDEHIPVRLKNYIEKLGYKCSTVFGEDLKGSSDKNLINVCKENDFILVTLDNDFSNPISYPIKTHNGIILLRARKQGADHIINLFDMLVKKIDIKFGEKSILIFDGNIVKVRK